MSGNNRIHPRDSSVTVSDVEPEADHENDDNETHKSEESLLFAIRRGPKTSQEEEEEEEYYDDHDNQSQSQSQSHSSPPMYQQKPLPPPGTYVIQIPKDQIYRLPPPENARRFQNYTRRGKTHRSPCCCRCLYWILGILSLLAVILAISTGIFYLVIRPKSLDYSIEKLSIRGFNNLNNLTTSSSSSELTFSPEFDVIVTAQNPNKKIGVYYKKGSSVTVSYSTVQLATGVVPVFYQPPKNVTVFQSVLSGKGIRLSKEVVGKLTEEEKGRNIPLKLDVRVPVRIKLGGIKTWTIIVKVHCDISVNKLAMDPSIVSNKCGGVKVKLF